MSERFGMNLLLVAGLLFSGCAGGFDESQYEKFASEHGYFADRSFASVTRPGSDEAKPVADESGPDDKLPEPQLTKDSRLRDYLAYAALHSPELEAAFADWKAALERVPQAASLPDPQFSYKYFVVEQMMRDGNMRHAFELSQTFPWLEKLTLRKGIAAEEAKAAYHRFETAQFKLFYRIQKAYGEYYYLRRAIQITEQNIELLNQIEAVARRRYVVGADSHPDVIRAQVEQGKLADRLRTLQKLRAPVMARLNAALNRTAGEELPWPEDIPVPASDLSDEQLLTWAVETNPEVQAMTREIDARRQAIDLARKDYYPDVMVGVEYDVMVDAAGMSDDGKNPIGVMVGLSIPIWWQKYAAGVREAQWRHSRAVLEKTALLNNLSADVETAVFEFQDAGRKINLYRDTLVPKAEQALQATQIAYSAGKADFQDYLDAQRVLLEFQLSHERSRTNRAQRMAELEMLVGKALPPAKEE